MTTGTALLMNVGNGSPFVSFFFLSLFLPLCGQHLLDDDTQCIVHLFIMSIYTSVSVSVWILYAYAQSLPEMLKGILRRPPIIV